MCAHLRNFAIDRLRRRRSELRHKPIAIIETSANRQIVMAVSDDAPEGVRAGMTLAQTRAHCARIVVIDAEPEKDRRGLVALGYWMMRFSPNVAIDASSLYCSSIYLDVSGMELLFGDARKIATAVESALRRLNFCTSVAIAPTPAAAWGLAVFGGHYSQIVDQRNLISAISVFPPEALQLEPSVAATLNKLGICSIGHLLKIPREQLVARFGHEILYRIDEATGAAHQQMNWLPQRSKIGAEIEFDGVIESLETLHIAFQKALNRIVELLTIRGLGGKHLRMILRQPYAPTIEMDIRLMRASRDAHGLFILLRHTLEAVQTDSGFVGVGLVVVSAEKVGAEQAALVDDEGINHAVELDHLIDRLRAKFGDVAEWAETRQSYLPERAFVCRNEPTTVEMKLPSVARPLSLLPRPRGIRVIVLPSESRDGQPVAFTDQDLVHRLEQVRGPERIGGQWWNLSNKTRDYFDVLDSEGNRFWLFRVMETNQWYLHGIFE
jgi:protein ImuB